jgi:PTH2 family peptidyl-tRNA hydrolase
MVSNSNVVPLLQQRRRPAAADVDPAVREAKQVIVVRDDLGMSRGKEDAQVAHAAMAWLTSRLQHVGPVLDDGELLTIMKVKLTAAELAWTDGSFTKIVCCVQDEVALLDVFNTAQRMQVLVHEIVDEGRTEFGGVHTSTAVAVGPDWADVVDLVTGSLKLRR